MAKEVYIAAVGLTKVDLTGIPAIRSETASSTGAAAFHEAYYKVASGQADNVLVLAGERMKRVTTEVATTIMSKTIDPEERRFGFTLPTLIAPITQSWFGERRISGKLQADVLARLMVRAHSFGSENPLGAFFGRPEPAPCLLRQIEEPCSRSAAGSAAEPEGEFRSDRKSEWWMRFARRLENGRRTRPDATYNRSASGGRDEHPTVQEERRGRSR